MSELAQAAHDLGAFNAQGLALVDEVESFEWATRRWLRGWVSSITRVGAGHAREHEACWRNPRLGNSLPPTAYARFTRLMDDAPVLLNLLDALPRSVAHHDAQWSNLFRGRTGSGPANTVAIDWSFLGSAPVGQDLGAHVALNICNRAIDPFAAARHDASATEAYFRGLCAFGWSGDERQVLFARATTGSLQMATWLAAHLSWICDEASEGSVDTDHEPPWTETLAEQENLSVDEVVSGWCAGFEYVLDLGDEARRLASALG